MTWLEEFLCVLAYSKRTQWAIGLGLFGFVLVMVAGDYIVSQLHFQGILAPLVKPVSEALGDRYDKAAWSVLGSFLLAAFKFYRKDRKRLLEL
ncbi:MAG: hypothetical protein QM739_14515 [Propionivibrio sp.]